MNTILQNMDVDNKKVIVRCDFNVPIKDNKIIDDYKIVASLDTINYLLSKKSIGFISRTTIVYVYSPSSKLTL